MNRVWFRTFVAILIIGVFYGIYSSKYLAPYYQKYPDATTYQVPESRVYKFPGLSGPDDKAVIPELRATPWQTYERGSNSRMAILLTDENSYWLDLVHGLKSTGIPFRVTTSYAEALKHKVVLVYPTLIGLPPKTIKALSQLPKNGGTLIAQGLVPTDMYNTFGIKKSEPIGELKLSQFRFVTDYFPTKEFSLKEQTIINVGDRHERTLATTIYSETNEQPLALYENGQIAVTQKTFSGGYAYLIGTDLGRFLGIGYSRRQWSKHTISNKYVNHYEPHIDTLMQLLKNMYLQTQKNAITIRPVPAGKSLAVIFSFDNDSAEAVASMNNYQQLLTQHGLKGTFFILTKYITDSDDFAFFTLANLPLIKQLIDAGMEVSSEGVSHSFEFRYFAQGTGEEKYPEYQPYVMHTHERNDKAIFTSIPKTITYNGSLLGELRVSRFLLKHFFQSLPLSSFRPGFLKNPTKLPQTLAATGFSYNSSTTAGDSLTHLPFQLNHNRGINSLIEMELPVYEFPITVEDQKSPAINKRVSQALDLARKISTFGGIYVVLIHPDPGSAKLEFLDKFIKQVPMVATVWFGTLKQFGDWWLARDKVEVDYIVNGDDLQVTVNAPKKISNLTLNLPKSARLISVNRSDADPKQIGDLLILQGAIEGIIELNLKIH